MKKTIGILSVLVFVLSFSLVAATPVGAQSWLDGWSHRVRITIDSGKIDGSLTDFPVLLYLSTSSGSGSTDVSFIFDELGASGKKIAVTTGDGTTQCYVEIEKWDSGNEQAWLWAKVPSIASGVDTVLYLYYDNTKADNTAYVGDTGSIPAQNVWDSSFVFVSHMRDDPDTSSIRDSTANNNDGTKKAGGEPAEVATGRIDGAQVFDGSDDYIQLHNEPSFDIQTAITVEGWMRLNSFSQPSTVASKWRNLGNNFRGWLLAVTTTGQPRFYVSRDGIEHPNCAGGTLSASTWYHLAGTYGDGSIRLFVNSSPATPVALSGSVYANDEPVLIGASDGFGGTVRKYTNGIVDEVRISNVVRSAAWIRATYETGNDGLLSYGSEQSAAGCIATYTSTGTACFTPSHGAIVDLVAVAAPGLPSVAFPHGMFSFRITGLTTGQTVTLEVDLPQPVPLGTVWWKYDNGRWHSLPNLNDNGNNIMVIRLTDGGTGDLDNVPGQITDPGGPGNPMTVGWDGSPVSRATVVAPWIALLAAMVAGVSLLVWRRRRSEV